MSKASTLAVQRALVEAFDALPASLELTSHG